MARVRRRKDTYDILKASPLVVDAPHFLVGQWQSLWPQKQPLAVEIGCGRSRFITAFAKTHPHKNVLGIDVVPEVIVDGLERWGNQASFPENIRYLWLSAEHLEEIFACGEIAEIYLNFSDPWPKNRHAKRRLTHPSYLAQYAYVLSSDGFVEMKTDGRDFFEYSLNAFLDAGWRLAHIHLDLHRDAPEDNIETEYERRFMKLGKPIYKVRAYPPSEKCF